MAEIIPFAPEQDNTCVGSVSSSTSTTTTTSSRRALALAVLALSVPSAHAWEETCDTFASIYEDGKGLCEKMFGTAFKYETDEAKAYTMWFFDKNNPNEATAAGLGLTVPDTCELSYFHKEEPSAEGDDFTECLPWKEKACCKNSTVVSAESLRNSYGAGYEWDRCGPMTQECSRFFVQEACLYECDVTAGLYRKYTDEEAADENSPGFENFWQIEGMPIKASYCDAWFNACRNDHFCGGEGGDFFECAENFWEKETASKALADEIAANKTASMEAAVVAAEEAEKVAEAGAEAAKAAEAKALEEAGMPAGTVAIIVIACILAVGVPLICLICYMRKRERNGDPVFRNLVSAEEVPMS